MPGRYGMKMPKWLTRIEFVDSEYLGYWERQGWSNTGDRKTQGIIDDPRNLSASPGTLSSSLATHRRYVRHRQGRISTDGGSHWQESGKSSATRIRRRCGLSGNLSGKMRRKGSKR